MILALDYSDLSNLIETTNKISNELNQYCDDLSNKVQSKMHEVEGGMSSSLSSADYYVKSKINKIREKEANTTILAEKTNALLETAKTVDEKVKNSIQNNQTTFFKKHKNLRPANHRIALYALWSGVKDFPLIGTLLESYEQSFDAMLTLGNSIRYWWECEGGEVRVKNYLDIGIKAAAFGLAVVTAVTAGAPIVVVAASIAAVIAGLNMLTNAYTSWKSIEEYKNGDYAMSVIQEDRDSLSSLLKESNFNNKFWNNVSNDAAMMITITDQVCGIITLSSFAGKSFSSMMSKNGIHAFKVGGVADGRVTLKSFWQGSKAIVINKSVTGSSTGLRTTLVQNVKASLNTLKASGWKNVFKTGSNSLFETAKGKYGLSLEALKESGKGVYRNINQATSVKEKIALIRSSGLSDEAYKLFKVTDHVLKTADYGTDVLANVEGSGKVLAGYYNNKLLYELNDYGSIVEKSGLAKVLVTLDKTNIINDYTAPKNGIPQRIWNIGENSQ